MTEEIFGAQQKSKTEARRKFQERLPSGPPNNNAERIQEIVPVLRFYCFLWIFSKPQGKVIAAIL